jgi:hypothetical protein
VNAAFLLVTTAWLAGDAPVITTVAAPSATPAASGSCCGSSCDSCCERRCRLHGLFNRGCNDCNPCPAPKCHRAPKCCNQAPADCCGRRRLFQRNNDCCPTTTCNDCCKPSLCDRIRGLFSRNNCCDSCCDGTGAVAPKKGEQIPAPKKMPGGKEPPREVRIDNAPAAAPAATPALEVAPSTVPALDADNRNPF